MVAEGLAQNMYPAITVLNLRGNFIGEVGMAHIASALQVNKTIKSLDLDWNKIGPVGASKVAEALRRNTTLTCINLDNNEIGEEGVADLADSLRVNRSVSSISLYGNKLGDSGAACIAGALRANASLTTINLRFNKITDAGAAQLAEAVRANSHLTSIDLKDNRISQRVADEIQLALTRNTGGGGSDKRLSAPTVSSTKAKFGSREPSPTPTPTARAMSYAAVRTASFASLCPSDMHGRPGAHAAAAAPKTPSPEIPKPASAGHVSLYCTTKSASFQGLPTSGSTSGYVPPSQKKSWLHETVHTTSPRQKFGGAPAPAAAAPKRGEPAHAALLKELSGGIPKPKITQMDREELEDFQQSFRQYYQMHHEDYNEKRIKAGKKPLIFIVTKCWTVENATLEAWFDKRHTYMRDVLKRDVKELKTRVAFHGTRAANIDKICQNGLLRVGHPMNPSVSTDPGFFGDPHKGVYASRFVEYCLQYSNMQYIGPGESVPVPVTEGDVVKIVMFKTLPGRSFNMSKMVGSVDPTSGYDSHSSPEFSEWFFFDETQLCPTHIVELRAITNLRTGANDGIE
eukprot:m51a1_g870 hypothetical protein (571) ;mRNA; r:828614-831043